MQVILYRRNQSGTATYYSLDDRQPHLFNQFTLSVRWGSSPEGGRSKLHVFDSLAAKNAFIRSLLVKKLRDHQVLYSFFKQAQADLEQEARTIIEASAKVRGA